MKISKLFHWLYATLMFLPLVFFIPSVFYYGFNEHATNTETTTINYKYQSNEVNSYDDLIEGNIYQVNAENLYIEDIVGTNGSMVFIVISDINLSQFQHINDYTQYKTISPNSLIVLWNDGNDNFIDFYNTYEQWINNDYTYNTVVQGYFTNNFIIQYIEGIPGLAYTSIQYTDYNVIESVSVNTDDTISTKLYRSWNSIFDLPMFSWTKTTFVSAPFTYITGLFGLASDNPINYLFGYFASISICWLVFDLILYVPNIAHRWLDRSALE